MRKTLEGTLTLLEKERPLTGQPRYFPDGSAQNAFSRSKSP